MKKNVLILYSWTIVAAWYLFILLVSRADEADVANNFSQIFFNIVSYQLAYGILFLLTFKASLTTLKLKVERLMYFKSKREKVEDREFALIIEGLLLISTIFLTLFLVIIDEYNQIGLTNKIASINDILANLAGIMMFVALTIVVPITNEIDIVIGQKISQRLKNRSKVTK